MADEAELSEEPADPNDPAELAEDEKEADDRRSEVAAEVAKAALALTGSANTVRITVTIATMATPAADAALDVKPVVDPRVKTTSPATGASEKAASDAEVKKVAADAAGTDPATAEGKKEATLKKYVIAFTLLSLFGPQLKAVFEALTRTSAGKASDDLITDDKQRDELIKMAEAWQNEDDGTYWADFAKMATKLKLTAADCVFFLQFTMLLSPLGVGDDFNWKTSTDLTTMVDDLFKAYTADPTDAGKATVLSKLATLTYEGLPLPRLVAADLGQRTMAKIALNAKNV